MTDAAPQQDREQVYFLQKHLQYDTYYYRLGKAALDPPIAQRKVVTAMVAGALALPVVVGLILLLALLAVATRSLFWTFVCFVVGGVLLGGLYMVVTLAYQGADHRTRSGMTVPRDAAARLGYLWRVRTRRREWSTSAGRDLELDDRWQPLHLRRWAAAPDSRWLRDREEWQLSFRESPEYRAMAERTGEAGRPLPAPRLALDLLDDWNDPIFARLREVLREQAEERAR